MAPQIEQTGDPSDFDRIVNATSKRLADSGEVDYGTVRRELAALSVPLSGLFNPEALARDLARIQALKDRAIAIVAMLTDNYLMHKRISEMLVKGWPKYSMEKSAEKREGEAQLKMSQFLLAATDAESAYRHALGIMRNLESQQENVSRQISCAMAASNILDKRYAFNREPLLEDKPQECDDAVTNWENLPEQ